MNLTPSEPEKQILEDIWSDQAKVSGSPIDLTSKLIAFPDDVDGGSVEDAERMLVEMLGWPQWARFYAKAPQAVIAAGKWAEQKGLPKGVCWMAPGAGAPFDPPDGPPGVFMLRADWAPSPEKLQQAAKEAKKEDGLLVVDETTTGFRLAQGGATQAFGLDPDAVMIVFSLPGGGKLAALAGKGEPAPDAKKLPSDEVLSHILGLFARISRLDTAARCDELGRLFSMGLEYYCNKAGLTDEVNAEGPLALPRLAGRRLWAFLKLAGEEGLFLEPLVLFGADMQPESVPNLIWARMARAIARLRVLPEGDMAPKGWKEAAPSKCLRVDEILRSLD